MLFNIAYLKTVIPRGDQHEARTAESEGGPHKMSAGGAGEGAAAGS